MRKIFLLGTALIALTIAAACSGGGSSDDATTSPTPSPSGTASPTPTPVGPFNITVNMTGWPHTANGWVRVLDTDSSGRVVFCKGPIATTSGVTWTASTSGVLTAGHHFKAESWVDLTNDAGSGAADGNFDPAAANTKDHDYFQVGPGTASSNMTITVDHTTSTKDTTWTANTTCPG